MQEQVVSALKTCYDPEIPVNIYDLGMVYEIRVEPPAGVHVRMTLTSPFCPAVETLPLDAESKIRAIPGVDTVKVEVVWEPPWTQDKISEAAKLQLGLL